MIDFNPLDEYTENLSAQMFTKRCMLAIQFHMFVAVRRLIQL